ncbi:MAG TPA: hypothetical protein VEA40_16965 [Ramlibacter sp.]|nr:hypothetical protein [Ramlibacter sp.]
MNPLAPDALVEASEAPLKTPRLEYDPAASAGTHARLHRFAGSMHRAIDRLQQRLQSSGGRGAFTSGGGYGAQPQAYGERLREQVATRPWEAAGIAVAAGVVLDKLLLTRSPKPVVVRVRTAPRPQWEPVVTRHPRVDSWAQSADSELQDARMAGHEAAGRLAGTTAAGVAGTKAAAAALGLQLRLAGQRMLAKSQDYGTVVRSEVEAHPLVGIGAALGLGALVTTLLMRRYEPVPGAAYVKVDEDSGRAASFEPESSASTLVASHPVASAAVVLGLGALVGALLARR